MDDRSAGDPTGDLALIDPSAANGTPVLLAERPAAGSGVLLCGERLPRDVLLRLGALSRDVRDIRAEHARHRGLSLQLDRISADLDALTQSIYDDTALHFAGRRG